MMVEFIIWRFIRVRKKLMIYLYVLIKYVIKTSR